MRSPPTNGSFQDFVTAMRDIEGEEATARWLEGMADNDARTYTNNNAIVEAAGRPAKSTWAWSTTTTTTASSRRTRPATTRNHQFAAGDVGGLVIPSSASVLAASGRSEEAERFIAFLLLSGAQEYFAEETFPVPLAQDVPPAEGVPPAYRRCARPTRTRGGSATSRGRRA